MFDLTIFTTPEAWISLITLLFLEFVLGVDNIAFIAITCDRLPEEKRHIGRKLGLLGALVMRTLFLSCAFYLVHLMTPLFTVELGAYAHGFSVRDLVLAVGGAYLIYKGVAEIHSMMTLADKKAAAEEGPGKKAHAIALPQAVGTIMVMDIVFSIDSVITAVGLANHLIIMILAVMIAILIMMAFIDPISDYINKNEGMKLLALVFIAVIGILLVLDGLGITSGVEVLDMHLEKLMVYFAMLFAVVLELLQIHYAKVLAAWYRSRRG